MTPTARHLLAWMASIFIFCIIGYFVWQANYDKLLPAGSVEPVQLEVTQNIPAPEQPVKEAPPLLVRPKVLPKAKSKTVTVAPTIPEETSPVEEPKPEDIKETADASPAPLPQTAPEEDTQETSTPTQEPASSGDEGSPTEQAEAGSAAEEGAPPQFGTPGSLLNETQLTVMPGNKQPTYPWASRIKRQEGTVVLKAYIRENGTVDMVSIYQSSGHSALDKEAAEKYFSWKYNPGKSGWVLKPFKFNLKNVPGD